MKTLTVAGVLLLALSASTTGLAQGDELEAKHKAKLAEPWLKNAAWITDYDEALKVAARTKKPIFGYFTRSYAP